MLIDPPFEQLDEMQRCAASLKEAIGRMRQTVAAIWYPVKDPRACCGASIRTWPARARRSCCGWSCWCIRWIRRTA
jgi:hypothetical protein